MASTRFVLPGRVPHPHGLRDRRPWRELLRGIPAADHCLRGVVFTVGLVVILGGAALWMFSSLLTTPVLFAGLWIWSWEFVWARRLMHRFGTWANRLWKRVRRRPTKWSLITAGGVLGGVACWWAIYQFGLL